MSRILNPQSEQDTAFPIKTQSPPQSSVTQTPSLATDCQPGTSPAFPYCPQHPSGLTPQAPQPQTPAGCPPTRTRRHRDPSILYLRELHTETGLPRPSTSCTSVNSLPRASSRSLGAGLWRPNRVGGICAAHRRLDFRFPRRKCLRPFPHRIQGAAIFPHLTYKRRNSRLDPSRQGRLGTVKSHRTTSFLGASKPCKQTAFTFRSSNWRQANVGAGCVHLSNLGRKLSALHRARFGNTPRAQPS